MVISYRSMIIELIGITEGVLQGFINFISQAIILTNNLFIRKNAKVGTENINTSRVFLLFFRMLLFI